jgi:hypothetical protein
MIPPMNTLDLVPHTTIQPSLEKRRVSNGGGVSGKGNARASIDATTSATDPKFPKSIEIRRRRATARYSITSPDPL